MQTLKTSHKIAVDVDRSELFFSIAGLWTRETMEDFLKDLSRAALTFIKNAKPFVVLGDLSDFVPQDRATAAAIQDSILEGKDNGLSRFAVVSSSSLVRMQYRRITAGIDVEFFDDIHSAEIWLRTK